MKDYIIIIGIGLIIWIIGLKPLGKYLDIDNGDYKKHNKHYKMEAVK